MLWTLTVFVVIGSAAHGWETWNDKGNALRISGNYRGALHCYKQALTAIPEKERSASTGAMLLNNIATARLLLGDLSRAANDLQTAYQAFERVQPGHPDNALVLLNLATLWRLVGRIQKAREESHNATLALQHAYGSKHPDVALSLNLEGEIAFLEGRCSEAGPLFELARAIWSDTLGPHNFHEGTALNNLAVAELCMGRPAKAFQFAEAGLKARRGFLPSTHPEIAQSLFNCAAALQRFGRKKEARVYRREAEAIRLQHTAQNRSGLLADRLLLQSMADQRLRGTSKIRQRGDR